MNEIETSISKPAVIFGVIIGIAVNWLALYLNIILGLISIGISSFVVLLLTRTFFRRKATAENLALVSIAYGATSAAEASIGLLFIIWLYQNAASFGLGFSAPTWLLPSDLILTDRVIFSLEWIVPLLTHYFLMFIPGITGLILGIYLAPRFIHRDKEYPFPGTIQAIKSVEVLVTNERSKVQLFIRFLFIGFLIAVITLIFLPSLDVSNSNTGMIFGLYLGTIGVTMFAVGLIINQPKITIPIGISSVILYTLISPLVLDFPDFQNKVALGQYQPDFFGLYSYLLQNTFLSFLIGFILSAALLSPIVWNLIKKIIKKNNKKVGTTIQSEKYENNSMVSTQPEPTIEIQKKKNFFLIRKRDIIISSIYLLALLLSTGFVILLDILPGTDLLIILLLLFWILLLGSFIQGILTVSTVAKSSTAVVPPFIFDNIPIFLTGARGFLPYIATPKAEVGETIGVVSALKFGQKMKLSQKHVLIAYFAGYLVAALSTPFFALFLWSALGIGTAALPAPAFPIYISMIGPFAAGSIELFVNIAEVLIGAISALFFPGIGISLAIGMFFPPHMALCLSLGGITALLLERHRGKEWMKSRGAIAATALSVGATLTVPILILLNLLA
ncbi:OPT/YSL family transporter [Candidatus Hodarchaeum mangrovi]